MIRVSNKRKDKIDYLPETRVAEGSILVTDCAKVYENINPRLVIENHSANHKLYFVHPRSRNI